MGAEGEAAFPAPNLICPRLLRAVRLASGGACGRHYLDRLCVRRRRGGQGVVHDDYVEAVTIGRLECGARNAILGTSTVLL